MCGERITDVDHNGAAPVDGTVPQRPYRRESQINDLQGSGYLNQFCEWCEENGIGSVRDLDGSHFLEYKFHLQQRIADSTIRNHFSTLRTFFKFCKRVDATDQNQELHKKLETPDFDKGDLSRDDMMDFDEVKKLLRYLNKFEYATAKHAMFVVFWHTGCRRGHLEVLILMTISPSNSAKAGGMGLSNSSTDQKPVLR